MKNQMTKPTVDTSKVASITALFAGSLFIIGSGAALFIYSFLSNIYFSVLSSQIHGAVFGVVVMFLGVRYFLSVLKLKAEVYKTTSRFSWSNFKTTKGLK